jgi:hypothetical protein
MTGPEKVRKLLASIESSNMQVAIATIRANDALRSDFDASVNFLRQYILTSNPTDDRAVAAARTTSNNGRSGGRSGGRTDGRTGGRAYGSNTGRGTSNQTGKDRWYSFAEWKELDENVKKQILEKREKRKIASVTIEEINEDTSDPSGGSSQRDTKQSKN